MLVLSRMKNEAIVIGQGANEVRVMVVEIRGNKVRLGVEAPKSIRVHREEIAELIDRQAAQSAVEVVIDPPSQAAV